MNYKYIFNYVHVQISGENNVRILIIMAFPSVKCNLMFMFIALSKCDKNLSFLRNFRRSPCVCTAKFKTRGLRNMAAHCTVAIMVSIETRHFHPPPLGSGLSSLFPSTQPTHFLKRLHEFIHLRHSSIYPS